MLKPGTPVAYIAAHNGAPVLTFAAVNAVITHPDCAGVSYWLSSGIELPARACMTEGGITALFAAVRESGALWPEGDHVA